ncbi:MAG: Glycogen phosphorylase [Phycisphaerae bacterium]|nr:Glycogen phosphorylase [Phycisphaerae bacterium]
MENDRRIAYFSMEIGLNADVPTYSGGLGVLAGDTIRSAADLRVPMVAVTLLHKKGYFHQKLDENGWQHEEPVEWVVSDFLTHTGVGTTVNISGREVQLEAWKYDVPGYTGATVPVYFLSSDLPDNSDWDRRLTDRLYGGDLYYRLCQEVILGIGGLRMLRALGYQNIERFHMNEGHAAFLALELLGEEVKGANRQTITVEDVARVRDKCVFTTHTPVPAGHDQFPLQMVNEVLRRQEIMEIKQICQWDESVNMTYLALNLSHYVNGVAKKHAEVSSHLFARYAIDSITNGVHASTWVSQPFQELFDNYIPGWRKDNSSLRYAENLPKAEVWRAHRLLKEMLIQHVNQHSQAGMEVDHFTIGFARRAATYKRADLFFQNIARLRELVRKSGPIQVIYGGKAHPHDGGGKELIRRIFQAREALRDEIKIVYLPNYDFDLARILTAGVDIWLNTPRPPLEASGTSGMKAALNGVPSLSILDGWWIEGCIEGVTGWAIDGQDQEIQTHDDYRTDAASLYQKLEQVILPIFYHDREQYINIMRHCIAINGSFFNTERMMLEYVLKAYFL